MEKARMNPKLGESKTGARRSRWAIHDSNVGPLPCRGGPYEQEGTRRVAWSVDAGLRGAVVSLCDPQ